MKLMARYLTREIAGGIMAVLLGFLDRKRSCRERV